MKTNNQKPVKIIQVLQDLSPHGNYDVLGLGDDGVLYVADNWRKHWRVAVGLKFAPKPRKESGDE